MKLNGYQIGVFLVLLSIFSACKKEDTDSFKPDMIGRWRVERIETRTFDASGTTVVSSASIPFQATDYVDFKSGQNDEVEMNLGDGNRIMGNYVVLMGDAFNISLSNKLLYCNIENLTDNAFQFTATVDKASPKVTETYYLVR